MKTEYNENRLIDLLLLSSMIRLPYFAKVLIEETTVEQMIELINIDKFWIIAALEHSRNKDIMNREEIFATFTSITGMADGNSANLNYGIGCYLRDVRKIYKDDTLPIFSTTTPFNILVVSNTDILSNIVPDRMEIVPKERMPIVNTYTFGTSNNVLARIASTVDIDLEDYPILAGYNPTNFTAVVKTLAADKLTLINQDNTISELTDVWVYVMHGNFAKRIYIP